MARYSSLAEGASFTREIYKIDQKTGARTRAGYARFTKRTGRNGERNDQYQGSAGGYNRNGTRNRNSNGVNARNGASAMQNDIRMAGANQAKARKAATRGTSVRL